MGACSACDTAAGYVIIAREGNDGRPVALMLKAANHHTWTPPKGYLENSESLQTCAARETVEETGVEVSSLTTIPEFRRVLNYTAWGRPKQVHYFLCVTNKPCPVQLGPEHDYYKWIRLEEYAELEPRLVNMQQMLLAAFEAAEAYWKQLK